MTLDDCQVEAHHCIWYGECGDSPVPGKKFNCNYTGPPLPLEPEAYDLLTVGAAFKEKTQKGLSCH